MAALVPPEEFGIVERGVYRAKVLQPHNFAFVSTLQLRKVLILSSEPPTRPVAAFFEENRIELVRRRRAARSLSASTPPLTAWRAGRRARRAGARCRCIWA